MTKPVALCILDGWGLSSSEVGNAPVLAKTPTFDKLWSQCPKATLLTHGPDAGLPTGQMGNSEVGHTNIGAGRVVAMDLGQIDLAVEDGSYARNPHIAEFAKTVKANGGTAHVMGVLSDGGVHGHITHMIETLNVLTAYDLDVAVHVITDGRDVGPKTAQTYLDQLSAVLPGRAAIASICGRYFALDRDNRWERVNTAYDAIILGQGAAYPTAQAAIEQAYAADVTDEFIPCGPIAGYAGIGPNDGLFCLNFRADRAREILAAFADPDFNAFPTQGHPRFAQMLGMVSYSDSHDSYMPCAFPKRDLQNTLGEWVSKHGLRQFRLAETEKYPHVTFFLNGGREVPFEGEDRFMPASPKVATYDLQPEMSADQVTGKFVEAIEAGYDLIVTNFANPDMVGHTGDLDAAIKSCEAVDRGLAKVLAAMEAAGGQMIITADHGNCEVMINPETGGAHTAHTTNPVPVILYGAVEGTELRSGRLADLAPTVLALLGLNQPEEMTGQSLLK